MTHTPKAYWLGLAVFATLLAGCEDSRDRAPLAPAKQAELSSAVSATLLECPIDQAVSATATIGALGGSLGVTDSYGGRHEVSFPAGAVSVPTLFKLTAPASQYVMVHVAALDPVTSVETAVNFPLDAQPTLAISYKRCPREAAARTDLQLFQLDEQTKAPITRPFGGRENNASDPRVRGQVPHFSEYAVGSPQEKPEETVVP
jgi:hypothetical protein